jgi:DNA-binding transcriptional LysR family regulator
MNYTLNQLQIFLKVVEFQSITKAAVELNLTQPAVSIQLKNFQDQFDIPLTEISGRKLYVTDFGHEIALAAEKIIEQVYAINFKTAAYKGKLSGKLRIAVVSTGKYIMPYFLSDFMKSHPAIELMMDVTNKKKVIESLENNEVDFALVSIIPKNLKVQQVDLLQNKLYLTGSSAIESGDLSELILKHPMIFRENGSGTRQMMESFFTNKYDNATRKIALTSNEAVKQALIAGLGISIMPLIGMKNELQNNELKIIPTEGLPIVTNWSVIWLKEKKHAPISTAFLDFIKENKDEIINMQFNWYSNF